MTTWTFEPGHSAAEFRARHMMVTWVRGHFKNVKGTMEFEPDDPSHSSVNVVIDANQLWTGEPARDAHLKSADFLDVANHPQILFKSTSVERCGATQYKAAGDLTIRGITRPVALDVHYSGQWPTPYWEDGVDRGPITRAGFVATTSINRHDFDVNWNSTMDRGGIVVGKDIDITIDVEALRDSDVQRR
jgi:polyisoprenoid-binding protein YceI